MYIRCAGATLATALCSLYSNFFVRRSVYSVVLSRLSPDYILKLLPIFQTGFFVVAIFASELTDERCTHTCI